MQVSVERVRERIEEFGGDGFFSLAPPVNQYLSGFTGSTSAILISQEEAVFLCDSRYTEQAGSQVEGYAVEQVSGSFMKGVGERMSALGIQHALFEPSYLTVSERSAISEVFEGETKAAAGIVNELRQRKTDEEIRLISEASALAEGVLADAPGQLRPGVTERELAAWFEYEFKKRGASGPSFDTIALFGSRSSLPHGQPGDRALESGDIILLDFGCRLRGYCSDLTRTYAFDTIPGAWFEEVYHLVLHAQQQAIAAVRPGMTCSDLDAVAREIIKNGGHGDHFGHGLGHGLGIEIHEDPRVNAHSDTVLEPGMVVTIEPGVYLPGQGGVRIEDVVAVTEDGYSVLSSTPRELKVLK
jgi:Xaa-Pro aminopeptidase